MVHYASVGLRVFDGCGGLGFGLRFLRFRVYGSGYIVESLGSQFTLPVSRLSS